MKKVTLGLAATGLIIATAQPLMAQEAMTEISDGVYHFWSSYYSSLVVIGDNGVLVTDPAFPHRADEIKAEIAKVTDTPISHVVLSHEHYDHIGGTESFDNAIVGCHRACEDITRISPLLPSPRIDQTYEDSLSIDLGGTTVELLHPAAGDGVATTVAHVPSADVVFSVDMYEPQEFTNPEFLDDSNFVGSRIILNELLEFDPTYAINGHSPGNSLDALKENAELYNKLYDVVFNKLQAAMNQGGPQAAFPILFSLPGEIKMDEYSSWKHYEEGFPAYVRRMAYSIFHGG